MANTCESPINAVMMNKLKMLCREAEGLNQKVRGPEQGLMYALSQTMWSPVKRRGLTHPHGT